MNMLQQFLVLIFYIKNILFYDESRKISVGSYNAVISATSPSTGTGYATIHLAKSY